MHLASRLHLVQLRDLNLAVFDDASRSCVAESMGKQAARLPSTRMMIELRPKIPGFYRPTHEPQHILQFA